MVVGILTLDLFIGESSSLKSKRRVLKSLIEKIKGRFNVAVAEVDNQDKWQHATLGISCISNDSSHVHQLMSAVVNFVEITGSVEVVRIQTELL